MSDRSRTDTRDRSLELVRIIGKAFHVSLDLPTLFQTTLQHLLMTIGAETGSVWLLDEERDHIRCAFVIGPDVREASDFLFETGEGIVGRVIRNACAERLDNAPSDPDWSPRIDAIGGGGVRGLLCAPMVSGGQMLGAVAATSKPGAAGFDESDLDLLVLLGDHVALAVQNALSIERERRARELQAVLRSVGQHFHTTLEFDTLVTQVFDELSRVLYCEALSLWLVDPVTSSLVCEKARGGADRSVLGMRVPLGQGIVGFVGQTQETVLIEDAQSDPRLYRSIDAATGFVTRSLICAPLVRQGRAIGVIQALNKRSESGHFAPEDLDLLASLADSAALAIENARLYDDLASSYDSTLDALTAALDLRDRETEGHSRRVVAYTVRLARGYGLMEDTVQEIARGALLHDIGKIGVPDAILHKPSGLTPEERATMERHPQLGYDMLGGIDYLKNVIQIVLTHQEKYDGGGYPRGLAGEMIPLGARLFAVADAYDAITSTRPYRASRTHAEAVEEIRRSAGSHFDPQVVETFLAIPESEWMLIREQTMREVQTRQAMRRLAAAIGG